MNFDFLKDQEMIRKSAREFLKKECPKDKVRELKEDEKGYDPQLWKKMVELEWMGLIIPEEYGGTGGDFIDLMIFMEEVGRNIVPSPFFATLALCAMPIAAFGTEKQKKEILPKIADGEIWTLALTESTADYRSEDIQLDATEAGDHFVLNGQKSLIPYADGADYFLAAGRTAKKDDPADGITLFIVDAQSPGIKTEPIPTTARDMRCQVEMNDVKVPKDHVLGQIDKGWEIVEYLLLHASVLKSAEMSGGAQAVLDITNQYAKDRVQFDRPIGALQAVQHKLVNMLIEIEGLKYLVHQAAWNISIGAPSAKLSSIAKAKANKVYQRVCIDAVYLHGAIGFTEEMDVGLYHLRTKAMEFDLGACDLHQERIAEELKKAEPLFLMNA